MSNIGHRPTWHYIACPICHRHRDLFCHDHGEPVKVEAVEVVPADQLREAVKEIAAWLQHVDRLDEIPGARISLPERNVLWDAAEAIRHRFGG
jgi:hypothetical protein